MPKEKLPLKVVKQFPLKTLTRLINKAKNYLKKDKVWQELCEKYDEDPSIIDLIPVRFGDLDVSGKTDHGVIILNYKLLCDGDFFKDYSYFIHEGTHWFQQTYGDKPTKGSDDGEYLENEYEQEGFQNQIEYIAEHFGDDDAEQYVDKLLKYHEIDDKNKKNEIEDVLTEKI